MCYYLLLLFGFKFLLGAEDRAHGCTREFLGHSDIAIRSYAPTFHLAVDNLIEAWSIMTFHVPLILIKTCFETMETFQMNDCPRFNSRRISNLHYLRGQEMKQRRLSFDQERKVGG